MRKIIALIGAVVLSLTVTACATEKTYTIGECNGVLRLGAGKGLVVATAAAFCEGTPPTLYSLALEVYADGALVATASSSTIPDSKGFTLSRSVICVGGVRYKALIHIVWGSPDGKTRVQLVVVRLKVGDQSQCK
jgi:hypothetical protein